MSPCDSCAARNTFLTRCLPSFACRARAHHPPWRARSAGKNATGAFPCSVLPLYTQQGPFSAALSCYARKTRDCSPRQSRSTQRHFAGLPSGSVSSLASDGLEKCIPCLVPPCRNVKQLDRSHKI